MASASPVLTAEAWLCFSIYVTAGESGILRERALCPRKFSLGQVEARVRSPCPEVAFVSESKSLGGTARRDSQQRWPWVVVGTGLQMDASVGSKGDAELMKWDQPVTSEAKPCDGGRGLLSSGLSLLLRRAGGEGGVTHLRYQPATSSHAPHSMGWIWS